MKNHRIFTLTVFTLLVFAAESFRIKSHSCGYKSCHPVKDGFINVHLVPHTHDDVGWLKTVDQYYYGSKQSVQDAGVQYILDSVVDSLKKNSDRKFIYVETAFFWKWWMKQPDVTKHQVKPLIMNGQLEFIGGGWTMNDEADTNYQSIIDQFTWGLRKLNDSFGECGHPKIGWQIDPFGHSREMASIFAQLGFDGLLLGRIDYQDRYTRFKSRTPEMVWQGSKNLGSRSNIFTGVMYNVYAPPKGFYFDIINSDDPIIDDKKSREYNVDKKVDLFLSHLKNMSDVYTTNNIIVTMGEDFNYQYAEAWYKNLDLLIKYTNERQINGSRFHLMYSTPSCYVKAVHDAAQAQNISWPVKSDDFFPYGSDPNAYWTGYFTSRPTLKRYERVGNNYLQVCKQLYAITDLGPEDRVNLNVLREAMGVLQHHDAIAGTEKENVAHDYARQLSEGFAECDIITSTALQKLMAPTSSRQESEPSISYSSCLLTNVSSCPFTENNGNFIVTVYNPLSRPVSKYVRLPVMGSSYQIRDPDGNNVPGQLQPISDAVLNIPGRESNATIELIFYASDIPPLGFKSYHINIIDGDDVIKESSIGDYTLGDISFQVDGRTGLISELSMNGIQLPITQELLYYKGYVGNNNVFSNRSSGAYIFRPFGEAAYQIAPKAEIKIYRGFLVAEVQQKFSDWASQTIRIYRTENLIEFDWVIGPIPTKDPHGKEVVSRFQTNLNSGSAFYTDSNGRELLKRIKDFRPTWQVKLAEPVAGNYYPVTSKILIRDPNNNIELAVLTDRAQGGSSLKDGQIELMVHRICKHDDAFGVSEPLMEEAFNKGLVVRGSHYLIAGPYKNSTGTSTAALEKDIAQRKLLDAWIFLSPTNGLSFQQYQANFTMKYSGLKRALPPNVQILTLEPWKGFSFLLRLEHIFEKNEDPELSKPAVVDLQGLFTPFYITNIKETTLGANQWLNENHRLDFKMGDNLEQFLENRLDVLNENENLNRLEWNNELYSHNLLRREILTVREDVRDLIITLDPMQIRTFVIDIAKNK